VTVLLTTPRLVIGEVDHGDVRLSDALNNPLESILRLTEAKLGRLGNLEANQPVSVALIPKDQVALVYPSEEAAPSADRRRVSYVARQTTALLVLLAGLRVRGHAHAAGDLGLVELHRLVVNGETRFVVLTDASLALDVEGMTERAIGVAMLNARHIQFVARVPVRSEDEVDPRLVLLHRV
jgi:hypothetical protein